MELEERLRQLLEQFPEIAVAVLFGSHATGRARPDSDLDVAILPSERCESRRKLQARISSALADLAPLGRVDVVFIDEAPTLLRQRIMEAGRELVMRDSGAWRDWRVRTMREHGDREPVRRRLRQAQRRRLSGGKTSGRSGRALDSLERVGKLSH